MAFIDSRIKKDIVHQGREAYESLVDGSRVKFHFQTRISGDDEVLDDSKKAGKPMELVIGKQFKLEVWEALVRTMAVGEVARFNVHKDLVTSYPVVAQTLRDSYWPAVPKPRTNHRCSFQYYGLGHEDLDQLAKYPKDLQFTLELLQVEKPEDYEKESWQMDADERLTSIKALREEGNGLYQSGDHKGAGDKYTEGMRRLEQLLMREKPGEPEWVELDQMKVPLLLNLAQIELIRGEYYTVIDYCSEVLKREPDNVKAVFRRGKAYSSVWDLTAAREDLKRAAHLDNSLEKTIQKILSDIEKSEKLKLKEEKEKLEGKLFS